MEKKKFLMLTRDGAWFLFDSLKGPLEDPLRLRDTVCADFVKSFEENARLGDAISLWGGEAIFIRVTAMDVLPSYSIGDGPKTFEPSL